jgi:hypothetical protein
MATVALGSFHTSQPQGVLLLLKDDVDDSELLSVDVDMATHQGSSNL